MKRTYILFLIVVGFALLLGVSEVRAQWGTVATPQRSCTAGALAIVDAGANPNDPPGQPTGPFPRAVTCPDECFGAVYPGTTTLLTGQFLRWDFRYSPFPKTSPSLVGVQVASDVGIVAAVSPNGTGTPSITAPCFGDSSIQSGANDCDSQWIKYPGNSTSTNPFKAYYFTGLGLQPRVEGVVVKSGSSIANCLLAGAGTSGGLDPNQAVADAQTFNTPGCTVVFSVAPNGKVIPGTIQIIEGQANCSTGETTEPVTIDGIPTVFIGPAQFTQPGSCSYCWTNTAGGRSCCTCTTCCVNSATGKCVLKSTIPSTQCLSGT